MFCCSAVFSVHVHYKSVIQYLKDQLSMKPHGNRQKSHSKYDRVLGLSHPRLQCPLPVTQLSPEAQQRKEGMADFQIVWI